MDLPVNISNNCKQYSRQEEDTNEYKGTYNGILCHIMNAAIRANYLAKRINVYLKLTATKPNSWQEFFS